MELASTTRLMPWRRAASSTLVAPAMSTSTSCVKARSFEMPPRCTTPAQPATALPTARGFRRSAFKNVSVGARSPTRFTSLNLTRMPEPARNGRINVATIPAPPVRSTGRSPFGAERLTIRASARLIIGTLSLALPVERLLEQAQGVQFQQRLATRHVPLVAPHEQRDFIHLEDRRVAFVRATEPVGVFPEPQVRVEQPHGLEHRVAIDPGADIIREGFRRIAEEFPPAVVVAEELGAPVYRDTVRILDEAVHHQRQRSLGPEVVHVEKRDVRA